MDRDLSRRLFAELLDPHVTPEQAADVVLPHSDEQPVRG
jgi:hypothetical protein